MPASAAPAIPDSHPQPVWSSQARRAASGAVVKAVRAVHAGDTWFGRPALFHALRGLLGAACAARIPPDEGRLTSREEEILHLIARGLSNKEIARELDISGHTVKTHLHHIYDKLHQSGRYKAVLSQQHRSGAIAATRSFAE